MALYVPMSSPRCVSPARRLSELLKVERQQTLAADSDKASFCFFLWMVSDAYGTLRLRVLSGAEDGL